MVLLAVTICAALSDFIPDGSPLDWRTAKVMSIFPALAFGAVWMLRLKVPMFHSPDNSRSSGGLSAKGNGLLGRLEDYLLGKEAFRDQDLTIASLSEDIGVSQHKLRALINNELGHPNFNAYINQIRVGAVCRAFDEPGSDKLPILTLALDAGFKSISVFNKAFKSLTGQTPSQYRALLAKNPAHAWNPEEFARNP
ncbi:AraC family transcriptional regulator [Pontixanthobacter sp. CEM42]|uniref:helix-turn-helix domain-containing protein n=1 Tax=Pontixanthobacter sp. CEM42 TaxID=2792077 RepID=UPI001ADF9B88|nr:AraC family transcriptional regulator [Pontixanthobacter sp. CEM42]